MNSKLREAIPDIVHRHGLTLDHELREGKTIGEAENTATTEAEKAIRKAVAEDMLELLGDDAVITTDDTGIDLARKSAANYVLMELRQKIKEYGGIETEL